MKERIFDKKRETEIKIDVNNMRTNTCNFGLKARKKPYQDEENLKRAIRPAPLPS